MRQASHDEIVHAFSLLSFLGVKSHGSNWSQEEGEGLPKIETIHVCACFEMSHYKWETTQNVKTKYNEFQWTYTYTYMYVLTSATDFYTWMYMYIV